MMLDVLMIPLIAVVCVMAVAVAGISCWCVRDVVRSMRARGEGGR